MHRSERTYRWLLLLLRRAMRREAETELVETFSQAYARARTGGGLVVTRFWLHIVADVVVASAAERAMPYRNSAGCGRRSSSRR